MLGSIESATCCVLKTSKIRLRYWFECFPTKGIIGSLPPTDDGITSFEMRPVSGVAK
jgi:hypothetical protein